MTPYIRAGNITEQGLDLTDLLEMNFTPAERARYALQGGDVLLAEASGSASQVGRAAMWRDELPLCCFQKTVIRFRPHAVVPDFALAVFRHYAYSGVFARTARGSGLRHLGGARFAELPFPLPPLDEQRRIVQVLSEKLGELHQAEEALRSALASTHERDRAILAGVVDGQLLFADSGGPRDGTTRPDHATPEAAVSRGSTDWTWAQADALGEIVLGKTLPGPGKGTDGQLRPYLRVANVLEDYIDFSDLNEMPFTDVERVRLALQPGDILLNEGQSLELVGRAAMYHGEMPELYFQNHLLRFRAGDRIDPHYALLVFRHYLHSGAFRRLARGSTNIAHLSRRRFAEMLLPVPPLAVQRRIVQEARTRLEASTDQRRAIESSLQNANEMTSELLRAAVSGQLVPQDPADESAHALLERLGSPPDDPSGGTAVSNENGRRRPARPPTPTDGDRGLQRLINTLRQVTQPVTVVDFVRTSKLDSNNVDEIAELYVALRTALDQATIIVNGSGETATLRLAGNNEG